MAEKLRYAGELLEVALIRREPDLAFSVDGTPVDVASLRQGPDGGIVCEIDGRRVSGWRATDGSDVFVRLQGRNYRMSRANPGGAAAEAASGDDLRASMPGVVVSVECEPGQGVRKGQTLVIIESMKMQTIVAAPRNAVVADVHVTRDSSFERGATLISLRPDSE